MEKLEKIESILNSAKSINSVEPNPYLYNKIRSRLEQEEITVVAKPLAFVSLACMILLLSVNLFVLVSKNSPKSSSTEMMSLVNHYSLIDQSGLNY